MPHCVVMPIQSEQESLVALQQLEAGGYVGCMVLVVVLTVASAMVTTGMVVEQRKRLQRWTMCGHC